jgi:hypothetical protein
VTLEQAWAATQVVAASFRWGPTLGLELVLSQVQVNPTPGGWISVQTSPEQGALSQDISAMHLVVSLASTS